MSNKTAEKTYSKEAIAIADFLKANAGKKLSLAEIAEGAGVKAESGYLRAVKAILGDKLTVGAKDLEVIRTIKSKVNSYTYND